MFGEKKLHVEVIKEETDVDPMMMGDTELKEMKLNTTPDHVG